MSSIQNVFQPFNHIKYNDAPLDASLLIENSAWIDERLREMYYSYALTDSNWDEYEKAGLLKEKYAWVDERLEEMCAVTDEDFLPCPLPLRWGGRDDGNLVCIEDDESSAESSISNTRKRSESDISDYEEEAERAIKRLRCQSPILTGFYHHLFTNPFLDCELYNEHITATADEAESVSSLELDSECGDPNCFVDAVESLTTSCDVNVVSDEELVYYDTDYDCDGYDSP